jgi:uncharacterized membrane protein
MLPTPAPANASTNATDPCAEEQGAVSDIGIGVMCALVGSFILAIGMVGQRYAHLQIAKTRPGALYLTQPLWVGFFLLFVVGNLGDLVALTFAPQSVITPLGSMSLVSNAIASRVLLKEELGWHTALGGLTIIVGVLGIVLPTVLRAPCSNETPESLVANWQRLPFIVWVSVQLSALGAAIVFVTRLERKMLEGKGGCCAEMRLGQAALARLTTRQKKALRLGYVFITGLLASWTVLFLKCAGELFKAAARMPTSPLADPRSYALIAGVVVTLPTQLHFLNKSLQRFEAQFVVPALQAFWSISSITKGAIFFGEFDEYAQVDVGCFAGGLLLTLAGVLILSRRSEPSQQGDEQHPQRTAVTSDTAATSTKAALGLAPASSLGLAQHEVRSPPIRVISTSSPNASGRGTPSIRV